MKKRYTQIIFPYSNNKSEYSFNMNSLNLPNEYKHKEFTNINEIFNFVILLFESKIKDYINLGIVLLKSIKDFNNDTLLNKAKIPIYFLHYLNDNSDNKIVVNEIISAMINLTYISNTQIALMFTTENFIYCFFELLNKYNNDMIIKRNLITLFGNLVSGDANIQKIFFQLGIFNVIYPIAKSNELNEIKEISIWFIACFVNHIIDNCFFNDKQPILLNCQKLLIANIFNEKLTLSCLIGLESLSESDNEEMIWNYVKNEELMKFILSLPLNYIKKVNTIICNLSSNEEDVNLILIEKYNVFEFLNKVIECEEEIKGEAIWTLSNFAADNNQDILQFLLTKAPIGKIFEYAKGNDTILVKYSIDFFFNLIMAGEKKILNSLYQIGVIELIIEVIKRKVDLNVFDKALDGLYCILNKSKKKYEDNKFQIAFENKGIKELLRKIIYDSYSKKHSDKAQNILDNFFSDSGEFIY